MKENYEIFKMLKTMASLDLIVGLALCILVGIIDRNYLITSLLGFFMAVMSFYINAYLINRAVAGNKKNSKGIVTLNFLLRVVIISAIGLLLFTYNKFSLLTYIGGYSCRVFSLIMYGLIIKNS
jgi:ATP synthase protein I